MGYKLSQRITSLRKEIDVIESGKIAYRRTIAIAFATLALVAFLIPSPSIKSRNGFTPVAERSETWEERITQEVEERARWLDESPFSLVSSERYLNFATSVVQSLNYAIHPTKAAEVGLVQHGYSWLSHTLINALLKFYFACIAFWPMWTFGILLGIVAERLFARPQITKDILGICRRGISPFYSGIYGPLKPNHSFSGSDQSCPSLATPELASRALASKHRLASLLRRASALNETNLQLVQVILAYNDFPAHVDPEQADEHEARGLSAAAPIATQNFITSDGRTIEKSALEGLRAVLQAHRILQKLAKTPATITEGGTPSLEEHFLLVKKLGSENTPIVRLLLNSLTPTRARSIAQLPAAAVATAYLATEAGKSLVYKKIEGKFIRISRFPNLQARAVMHSLLPYHQEHDGDMRLIIRQAVICSRRHGDFGRAFLPNRMPLPSRALRDWLEILYHDPDGREDAAHMVELDAHIEEVNLNWRRLLAERLQSAETKPKSDSVEKFARGIPYKSVVLMPIESVVEIALGGFDLAQQKRILHLLDLTRKLQTKISISARLPGFKRQAVEAQTSIFPSGEIIQKLQERPDGQNLLSSWLIIRRMLTRYNWLSTRVGDEAVPVDGLVQAVILDRDEHDRFHAFGLPSLVPVRERRFKELFGQRWEKRYYPSIPHPDDVEIFTDPSQFNEALEQRRQEAKASTLSVMQGGASSTGGK